MIFLFAEIPWKSKTDPCEPPSDRKSTRLNSSHDQISYAVFCLKKKNKTLDEVAADEPPTASDEDVSRHRLSPCQICSALPWIRAGSNLKVRIHAAAPLSGQKRFVDQCELFELQLVPLRVRPLAAVRAHVSASKVAQVP